MHLFDRALEYFFFFSSRRRHTRLQGDWSSDVCSSDLVRRIQSVGLRSINNVCDATNYMLHGFGQPMHAFDLEKLARDTVVVRKTRGEELIRTLDGVDRTLPPGAIVIGDAERAQAIGGIIGGSGSEVTDETTEIFLEVAAFDPARSEERRVGEECRSR